MAGTSCSHSEQLKNALLEVLTLDPEKMDFSDKESVKAIIVKLLNIIEYLLQRDMQMGERIKALEDEINRLKGEKGRPKIKPNVPLKENDVPNQKKPEPWKKNSKISKIRIDRIEYRKVDRRMLPPDAKHKGYRDVIVQDINFTTDNVKYRLERFYSKRGNRFYEAKLPEGVKGEFGPGLKAFIHYLYFRGRVTENKIHEMFSDIGISVSEGQISNVLTMEKTGLFSEEKQEVYEEGMEHADYFNTDETGARHMGKNHYFHVVCTLLFTAFFIRPSKNRETVEAILNLSGTGWQEKIMVSDDARQFLNLTAIQALCWIHSIRHYRKLNPLLDAHRNAVHGFISELWEYYHNLEGYKASPDKEKKKLLEREFDRLFSKEVPYSELGWRMEQTMKNRDRLLAVLEHPDIPIHNNDAEISVREPVIKRGISHGTRSEAGRIAWENMLSLSDTCRKLDVSFYAYLLDRFSGRNEIPRLACIIAQKAAA